MLHPIICLKGGVYHDQEPSGSACIPDHDLERGLYDKAIEDCTQAITLLPDTAMFHALRGEAYLEAGDQELAVKNFEKASDLDPAYEVRLKKKLEELQD